MSEFDLGAMFQQAQDLQRQMEEVQRSLDDEVVEAASGGGKVKVKATGNQRILSVEIDPSVLGEDRELLQDLVMAAVNSALDRSRERMQEKMGELVPPGMMGPGGMPGLGF